jgi:hypothetical protein
MPRAPKEVKRPAHRPLIEIDWKRVDKLLIAGCPGTKIADALGICSDTLYDRCEQEKGVTFSTYSQQKRIIGDALIQEAQFDKAIGNTDKGDNTLLIWLGKVRLEQKETTEHSIAPETLKSFSSVMDQLDEMQKNRQNTSS